MHTYRKEIDGLRAVAVLPVILYHGGFRTFFGGGYVGVDIFFVISGYLITSIIESECDAQNFSIINFYERRCRRILPALFLILFISSFFAYYCMLPSQLYEYGQSLISIIGLSSNFFFWWKDDGYFARLTELNPVVHTWSLAVEEQFYFIFPLLCYFYNDRKAHLHRILMYAALLSFFLAQWGGNLQPTENYQLQMFAQPSWTSFYLPSGRVWELLLGSFAAFYLRNENRPRKFYDEWKQYIAFLGLALIIISIVLLDSGRIQPFPNVYTLLPTFGATFIIVFGDQSTLVGRFLSGRLLGWVGLISYSAYLWHQPVLVFVRLWFYETPPFSCIVIAICAIFPLSAFSYHYIEQPFRQKQKFLQKHIFIGAAVATVFTFILALCLIHSANNRSMIIGEDNDTYLNDLERYSSMYYTALAYSQNEHFKTFSNSSLNTTKRLALIGDSYSQDFYNIIRETNYLTNYEVRFHYVHVDCQIYIGAEDRLDFVLPNNRQKCTNMNDIKYGLPLIREADVIILAASWRNWSAIRLPTTIKLLNLTSQQKIFVIGSKHFGKLQLNSYVNKTKQYRLSIYEHPESWFVDVNRILEQIMDPSIFVNVLKMICTGVNNTCPVFTRQGKLMSCDSFHLTKYGAVHIGEVIFNNPPLKQLVTNN